MFQDKSDKFKMVSLILPANNSKMIKKDKKNTRSIFQSSYTSSFSNSPKKMHVLKPDTQVLNLLPESKSKELVGKPHQHMNNPNKQPVGPYYSNTQYPSHGYLHPQQGYNPQQPSYAPVQYPAQEYYGQNQYPEYGTDQRPYPVR